MNKLDRGLKHVCPDCATKYYDLKRPVIACPKCGAGPAAPKPRRARAKAAAAIAQKRYP
jgi:hypothetical protein